MTYDYMKSCLYVLTRDWQYNHKGYMALALAQYEDLFLAH
jgi:hypothetical protein